jgi:FkbM family methyltransferase
LGHIGVRARWLWDLLVTAQSNPEKGATVCQEICAQLLLPGLCDPATQFVDVGAHIGSVVSRVRRRHPTIPVVACEADPGKAAELASRFPDVKVHSCAVGDREGEVVFFIDKARPGYSSLSKGERPPGDLQEIVVSMRRLDDLVPISAPVDVIKIDVEGAELGVLLGAQELITRWRPVVLFESGPQTEKTADSSIPALYNWFSAREYQIYVPNRVAHNGPPLSEEGFVDSHCYPFRTLNYFAIPSERRIEFRDRARQTLGVNC